MDTPICQKLKGPRRKLKKIMKKKNGSLHASTHNIYQKKLKSAINVSLNSTRNVSTLQANNRSLAAGLEKMRQDFRLLHDHNTTLLERNQELSERILELERLADAPASYIEEEVNRRFEVRTQDMRRKLKSLNTHASGFLEILMELTEMCSIRSSSASERHSGHSGGTPQHISNISVQSPLNLRDPGLGGSMAEHYSAEATSNRFRVNDLLRIAEQSVLLPTTDIQLTGASKLDLVSESDTMQIGELKKPVSKLPLRVPKQNREPLKQNSQKILDTVTTINTELDAGTDEKSARRETFILKPSSDPETESISDLDMPHNIVSDHLEFANKETVFEVDQVTPELPYCLGPVSNSSLSVLDKRENPRGKYPIVEALKGSKALLKQKQCAKSLDAEKIGTSTQRREKSKKKQELCISNEFELMNAHKQLMEKNDMPQNQPEYNAMIYRTSQQATEEHTIHTPADMELTMVMGEGTAPIITENKGTTDNVSQPIDDEDKDQGDNFKESRSGSKQKLAELTTMDKTESLDEKVPDAVTMRVSKPGQFVFAASRKEQDGTRKNLPNVAAKARSKSKKQMAEMIENLPQEEPKSIFDFHDKTPKSLPNEKQASLSVFSISADESALSPLLPLSKSRHRSKTVSERSEEKPVSPTPPTINIKQSCLGDGLIYHQQLKGSPDEKGAKVKYRTRSQSRGRTHKKSGDLNQSTRARSDSGDKVVSKARTKPDDKGFSGRAKSRGRSAKKSLPSPETGKTRIRSTGENGVQLQRNDTSPHTINVKQSCLGDGQIYHQQLKSSPDKDAKVKYRTRSHSRGRTKKKSDDLDQSIKAQPDSGDKVVRKTAASPNDKGFLARSRSRGRSAKKSLPPPRVAKAWTKSTGKKELQLQSNDMSSPQVNGSNPELMFSQTRSRGHCIKFDKNVDEVSTNNKDECEVDQKNDANSNPKSKESRTRDPVATSPRQHRLSSKNSSPFSRQALKSNHSFLAQDLSIQDSFGERGDIMQNPFAHSDITIENFTEEYADDMLERNAPLKKGSLASKRVENSKEKDSVTIFADFSGEITSNESKSIEPIDNEPSSASLDNGQADPLPSSQTFSKDSDIDFDETSTIVSQKQTDEDYSTFLSKTGESQVKSEVQKKNATKSPGIKKMGSQKVKSDMSLNHDVTSPKKLSKKYRHKSQSRKHGDGDEILANSDEIKKGTSPKHLDSVEGKDQGYGEPNERSRSRSQKSAISSLHAAELSTEHSPHTTEKTIAQNVAGVADSVLDDFETASKQLLDKVKQLKTPAMSKSEEGLTVKKNQEKQHQTTGPRVSKIIKKSKVTSFGPDESPNKPQPVKGQSLMEPVASNSPAPEGKRRRAATTVNYAEIPLNKKMRRGDPFTSHYCSADKLQIFKSPKSKAKKKVDLRRDVLGPLHNMAIKEDDNA